MPVPHFCPRTECRNHRRPPRRWRVKCGGYLTTAHGWVQRYRCRSCGKTVSGQHESLHYFAKRRLPLRAICASLLGGSSLREIAGRYRVSPMAVQNALLRLGRQAMAIQLLLLAELLPREAVVFDGFRSFLTSQDFPCDITLSVDPAGEVILSMVHTVFTRGGRMRRQQRRRLQAKRALWQPPRGAFTRDIALVVTELWDYLRPLSPGGLLWVHSDCDPLYRRLLRSHPVARHYRAAGQLFHQRTPATAPRTAANPLFAANYLDRLLRHRLREHTRETIAFARNATMQMHRAWLFAFDHNLRRPYRVKHPELGGHIEQGSVADTARLKKARRQFFTRRIQPGGYAVPESIRRVWLAELDTPPLRWRAGQTGSSVRIPAFARRELLQGYQQAR